MAVPFLDLTSQHRELAPAILKAWRKILETARFVSGNEVEAFEEEWAAAVGADFCVAVSSGTEALTLSLRALDLGPTDAVAVPASTFIATAEAVSHVGATPRLTDVDGATGNMTPDTLEAQLSDEITAVIPVHLYGQPVDIDALLSTADGRPVVFDAAQAHLARYRDQPIGGFGSATTWSFYPGKNLGAPGEGGAVTTNDGDLAHEMRVLRDHGQESKYHSRIVGYNARMTELVASTLRIKLPLLDQWTAQRRRVAKRYLANLSDIPGIGLPAEPEWAWSVYHLFVITLDDRDTAARQLGESGIGTGLHYPIPVHLQEAYRALGQERGSLPVAENRAERLLSLPMFPELTDDQIDEVCATVRQIVNKRHAGQ